MTPKPYRGRLAFDSDTGFHLSVEEGEVHEPVQNEDGTWSDKVVKKLVPGAPVVTPDGGKTWFFAEEGDPSHFDRYHEQFATVDGTANTLLNLQLEHGREKAEQIMRKEHPHHYAPTEDDPHFAKGATNDKDEVTHTRIRSTPDAKSAKMTGHTDAWKGGDK